MRILYLADIRFPMERANAIQTVHTCHALARLGARVHLLVRKGDEAPDEASLAFYGLAPHPNLTVERLVAGGPALARRMNYLLRAVGRVATARSDFDVALTRDLGCAHALLRVPPPFRLPLVYESHGISFVVSDELPEMLEAAPAPSATKLARLRQREQAVYRRAEGFVCITAHLQQFYEDLFGLRENLAVIHDGVALSPDRAFEPPPPRAPGALCRAFYVGHLYPWKGVDVAVEALAFAPRVRLDVVGGLTVEGDLARLKARALDARVADRVVFHGFVPPADAGQRLRQADLLLLPSRSSTAGRLFASPLKLFEYMAAGRPIVASDLPALGEVLHHEENALLVPADDPRALGAAMERLAEDPELGRRLAARAFEDVGWFTWDARAGRLARVLEAAAGARVAA